MPHFAHGDWFVGIVAVVLDLLRDDREFVSTDSTEHFIKVAFELFEICETDLKMG